MVGGQRGAKMSDKINSVDLLEEVAKDLQLTLADAQKADAGVGAAGVRVRKRVQEMIIKLKEVRVVVLNNNKSQNKSGKGE